MMKLTCVTAVFNAIQSGNRENLIRCVRSVAALKTEHEHLIYDGGSTDGTVELLRELEKKIDVENRCTAEFFDSGRASLMRPPRGDESGAHTSNDCLRSSLRSGDTIERALSGNESSAIHHSSSIIHHSPTLRVVSEPDTGIYNALNKGVRDAKGEWFYVLGCDDYICHPKVMDELCKSADSEEAIVAPIERERGWPFFRADKDLHVLLWDVAYSHQGLIMQTKTIRRYGGFDERYRICADWDLMRKAHDDGLTFRYTYHAFANYGVGGASESGDGLAATEVYAVSQKHLGLTNAQMTKFWRTKTLPWQMIFSYLKHRDYGYRLSAKDMLNRKVKSTVRILFYPLVIVTRSIWHRMKRQ